MKRIILPILALAIMASCVKNDGFVSPKSVEGYKPVYISKENAYKLTVEAPRTITKPGKMYLYQQYIYVTDLGNGVHILDNSDSIKPISIAYISIPGVVDAAVKNGVLYADNFTDIVAFDVSDLSNITFKKRIKDVYPITNQYYPEFATGYFECVDTAKGFVKSWEKTILESPKCYR